MRIQVSSWLLEAVADDGLLVPGRPARRTCDLLLRDDAVQLRAGDAEVTLRWEDLSDEQILGGSSRDEAAMGTLAVSGNGHPPDAWRLGHWSTSRSGAVGVGLHVAGECARSCEPVATGTSSFWNRLDRFLEPGTVLPLHTPHVSVFPGVDLGLMRVLCLLLAERPAWRARLTEPDRVRRLVADIGDHGRGLVVHGSGLRQRTFEIRRTMQELGYTHPWGGRPLPGDPVPSLDDIVPAVLARVRSSRYSAELDVSEDDVRAQATHDYAAVEPWPFAALTDD